MTNAICIHNLKVPDISEVLKVVTKLQNNPSIIKLLMATSIVTSNGDLKTHCLHVQSAQSIETDAPTDNGGEGQRFSPTDLLATALASCMLTVMNLAARSRNEAFRAEAEVTKLMQVAPRKVEAVEITIKLPKTLLNTTLAEVLEKSALNCPVALSLHPELRQIIKFVYVLD